MVVGRARHQPQDKWAFSQTSLARDCFSPIVEAIPSPFRASERSFLLLSSSTCHHPPPSKQHLLHRVTRSRRPQRHHSHFLFQVFACGLHFRNVPPSASNANNTFHQADALFIIALCHYFAYTPFQRRSTPQRHLNCHSQTLATVKARRHFFSLASPPQSYLINNHHQDARQA